MPATASIHEFLREAHVPYTGRTGRVTRLDVHLA